MALDPWPFLSTPPNTSIPEPLLYDSYIPVNESDPDLNVTETREPHQDKTSSVVITFIYFMVCTVGLCGNTLVIYVILRYAKMKTVTNIYILNLAVADVLCMMSLPFIALQLALVHWPFGEALCRMIMTVGGCRGGSWWRSLENISSWGREAYFREKEIDHVFIYSLFGGRVSGWQGVGVVGLDV